MESIKNYTADNVGLSSSCINTLNFIFKDCPDGVSYKDKHFRYMSANETYYKLFKIKSHEDFIHKKDVNFLTKENLKLVQDVNNAIKQDLQPISYLMNTKSENGTDRFLSITSAPISENNEFLGIISIVRDVTHEEAVKERFVVKHYQLKSLLENIPMIIYMQDKNSNYIAGTTSSKSFVEDGFDSFTNIHINNSKIKFEDEDDNKYVLKNNKILIQEKKIVDFKESPHWYKIYKVPINDFDNNVTGVITLANNIDAEKQLQTQRESFVASLGHDLKNPTIAQIRGLELLLKGEFGQIDSSQKELVEMILDSCRYMNGMLSSLLATYRNNEGVVKLNYEEFSFPDLVMECVSEMIYVAKDKEVEIEIETKIKDEVIIADRVQIKRVIMNLLSNGIKYAFKNTVLKLYIYKEGRKTCFKFENESTYIPEEKQKAIFAQYVSYASAHKEVGIGLGLYASQKIIEAHNGEIFVKSSKDNKNSFGFKIPAKQNERTANKNVCF